MRRRLVRTGWVWLVSMSRGRGPQRGDGRERSTQLRKPSYRGRTDAHEVMEHSVDAAIALVDVLVAKDPARRRAECLNHIRQALLWLETADLSDLDQTTRWSTGLRLEVCTHIMDDWLVEHEDEGDLYSGIDEARGLLIAIQEGLDPWTGHVQRLYAAKLISRRTRRELLHLDDEEFTAPLRDYIVAQLQELRDSVEHLPTEAQRPQSRGADQR